MFEQTLVTRPPATRKTAALFASLVAQILTCGVLAMAPLIFTDVLPAMRLATVDLAPPHPPPPQPPSNEIVIVRRSSRSFIPFAAPRRIPAGPVDECMIEASPPTITVGAIEFEGPMPDVPGLTGVIAVIPPPAPIQKAPPVAEPPATKASPPAAPIRVSGGAQSAKLIERIVPSYPGLARQTRASGTVHLLGIIAKDGRIRDLKILSGHPLLTRSALDAVNQWIYSPTTLDGQPVEVEAPIDVIFELR